ncbi:MAG: DUF4190 domain-containing protein [Promicromonosporaceae bacterium]|nr:DUF4190 domain-containing protein [Promicromonosporaceae bacterium]
MSQPTALEPQPHTREMAAVRRHAAAGQHHPAPDQTDGPSVASLWVGILGLVVPLLSVVAILLGSLGLGRAERRATRGRGFAKAGITLGVIELVFTLVVGLAVYLVWDAYGAQLQQGLHGVAQVSKEYQGLSDQVDALAGGDLGAGFDLAKQLGPSGFVQLAGDASHLKALAGRCQDGTKAACQQLVHSLPPQLATGH